jgi:hypothetical protein
METLMEYKIKKACFFFSALCLIFSLNTFGKCRSLTSPGMRNSIFRLKSSFAVRELVSASDEYLKLGKKTNATYLSILKSLVAKHQIPENFLPESSENENMAIEQLSKLIVSANDLGLICDENNKILPKFKSIINEGTRGIGSYSRRNMVKYFHETINRMKNDLKEKGQETKATIEGLQAKAIDQQPHNLAEETIAPQSLKVGSFLDDRALDNLQNKKQEWALQEKKLIQDELMLEEKLAGLVKRNLPAPMLRIDQGRLAQVKEKRQELKNTMLATDQEIEQLTARTLQRQENSSEKIPLGTQAATNQRQLELNLNQLRDEIKQASADLDPLIDGPVYPEEPVQYQLQKNRRLIPLYQSRAKQLQSIIAKSKGIFEKSSVAKAALDLNDFHLPTLKRFFKELKELQEKL